MHEFVCKLILLTLPFRVKKEGRRWRKVNKGWKEGGRVWRYKQDEVDGGGIFIFALRCCAGSSSGFVTYQFQFHVSVTYLMVFPPSTLLSLSLHCLSKNISNMTRGRKNFHPPPLCLFVKWNGIRPFLQKFICRDYFIMISLIATVCFKVCPHSETGKRVSKEIVEFIFFFSFHLSTDPPPDIHLFRQSACLACQIRCLPSWVVSFRLF